MLNLCSKVFQGYYKGVNGGVTKQETEFILTSRPLPQIFLTKFFSLQGIQDYFFQTGNVTVQTEKRIFQKGNGILQKRKLKLDATNFLVQKYFCINFFILISGSSTDIYIFLHLDHNQTLISVPVGTLPTTKRNNVQIYQIF